MGKGQQEQTQMIAKLLFGHIILLLYIYHVCSIVIITLNCSLCI